MAFTVPEIGASSAVAGLPPTTPAIATRASSVRSLLTVLLLGVALVPSLLSPRAHLCSPSPFPRERQHVVDEVPCLVGLERVAIRRHRRAGEPRHERPIHVL